MISAKLWAFYRHMYVCSVCDFPNVLISRMTQKQAGRRVLLPAAFRQPLTADLDRAKVITNAEVLITAGMWPHSVVENTGFHLVKILEACYSVPSHVHVSQFCSCSGIINRSVLQRHLSDLFLLFIFDASVPVIAVTGGIMLSGYPSVLLSVPFLWMRYLSNAGTREFLQIWDKRPLGLKDGLIRIWWSKVTVTSQNTILAIT